jgi:hypothetical protein
MKTALPPVLFLFLMAGLLQRTAIDFTDTFLRWNIPAGAA